MPLRNHGKRGNPVSVRFSDEELAVLEGLRGTIERELNRQNEKPALLYLDNISDSSIIRFCVRFIKTLEEEENQVTELIETLSKNHHLRP